MSDTMCISQGLAHSGNSTLHKTQATAPKTSHPIPVPETKAYFTGESKLYEIKTIPGRGVGCIATSNIARGTRILEEAPLFTVPKTTANMDSVEKALLNELKALTKSQQHAFFALHNAHRGRCSPVIGITKTNAIPFGSRGSAGGIFIRAARINHSCEQNAQNVWNYNLGKLTIHAIRDIEKGKEITIAYIDGLEYFEARQECLEEAFGFACRCGFCSLSVEESRARDHRLEEMLRLDNSLGDGRCIMTKPLDCLNDAYTLFRMLRNEGIIGSRISRVYNDALQISIAHGDQARAKVFAKRAYAIRLVLEGEDSLETKRLENLADDPSIHGLYGSSKILDQSVSEIPIGLSETAFDNWLWRQSSDNGLKV